MEVPETEADLKGWDKELLDWAHNFSGDNVKYLGPDGHSEAVYGPDGLHVTDDRDMESYNFAEKQDGIIGALRYMNDHLAMDIVPYIYWGNTPNDSTTCWQRVGAMIGAYEYPYLYYGTIGLLFYGGY